MRPLKRHLEYFPPVEGNSCYTVSQTALSVQNDPNDTLT